MPKPSGFGKNDVRFVRFWETQGSWFGKTVLKKGRSNVGRPAERAPGSFSEESFPGVDLKYPFFQVLGRMMSDLSGFGNPRVLGSERLF